MNERSTAPLADLQNSRDDRNLPINRVGIKDIRHPVRVKTRAGGDQHTVATLSMFVSLPHDFKGTHMSRFVEILNRHQGEMSVPTFQSMLPTMSEALDAEAGCIEMRFPYFISKPAPVTGVESLLDYEVCFIGEMDAERTRMTVAVTVPCTSLCPCSKKISRYGAHNQRSHCTITAEIGAFIWMEELIDIVEQEASCELYGLLKRPDEKFVTERAYDNPKFVEDLVRDVAGRLDADHRILRYRVEAENFESIHNHSAYALIDKDGAPTAIARPRAAP